MRPHSAVLFSCIGFHAVLLEAISNKCIASSNKCLISSNKDATRNKKLLFSFRPLDLFLESVYNYLHVVHEPPTFFNSTRVL